MVEPELGQRIGDDDICLSAHTLVLHAEGGLPGGQTASHEMARRGLRQQRLSVAGVQGCRSGHIQSSCQTVGGIHTYRQPFIDVDFSVRDEDID